MKCPKCGGRTTVFDTRSDGTATYRHRNCTKCHYTFYTAEMATSGAKYGMAKVWSDINSKRQEKGK